MPAVTCENSSWRHRTLGIQTGGSRLSGRRVPSWKITAAIVRELGGDEEKFAGLWEAAERERTGSFTTALAEPGRGVFIVGGRHERARAAVFDFLCAPGLEPHEWETLLGASGQAPIATWRNARAAQAVLAILTPDELVSTGATGLPGPVHE